jgi:uncharacterized membrane protein YcaP (DUF421 family)
MWNLTLPWYELVLRSVVVYVLFLAALRLSGKRELGQFTIFDLALVLLAANALQTAITGPDASLPGAAIIVATLFALNHAVAYARRRWIPIRRLLEGTPTILGVDGHWIQAALDAEELDAEDLEAALREHGLETVEESKLVTLERDGSISVVARRGRAISLRARQRRYRHKAPASQ